MPLFMVSLSFYFIKHCVLFLFVMRKREKKMLVFVRATSLYARHTSFFHHFLACGWQSVCAQYHSSNIAQADWNLVEEKSIWIPVEPQPCIWFVVRTARNIRRMKVIACSACRLPIIGQHCFVLCTQNYSILWPIYCSTSERTCLAALLS